jgi:hypothetical protein
MMWLLLDQKATRLMDGDRVTRDDMEQRLDKIDETHRAEFRSCSENRINVYSGVTTLFRTYDYFLFFSLTSSSSSFSTRARSTSTLRSTTGPVCAMQLTRLVE